MKIIADASPLIAFAILDELDLLLQLCAEIYLPPAVFAEVSHFGKPYSQKLHAFSMNKVVLVKNQMAVNLLRNQVDKGEAEAIVLALEIDIPDILIDDAKGRQVAYANGLHPIGTVGILLQAKRTGQIVQIKPMLDQLIANKIRIGSALYQQALILAKE